jgi:chromosomal replication initiator protein
MGGKDHSTIMHGCSKIESELSTNQKLKEDIAQIKEKIFAYVNN